MAKTKEKVKMDVADGGIASFLTSNLDEIDDSILAFGMPAGINSLSDIADKMAKMGRGGDNVVIHSQIDEMIIPKEVGDKNPELIEMAKRAISDEGGNPEAYIVGNNDNSINPLTGQREFFLKKIVGGVKKLLGGVVNVVKKIAPVILPLALNAIFPGMGAIASGAIGSGISGLIQGKSFSDSLRMALVGGAVGGLTQGITNVFRDTPFTEGLLPGREGYGFFDVSDNLRGTLGMEPRTVVDQGAADSAQSFFGKLKDTVMPDQAALQQSNFESKLLAAEKAGLSLDNATKLKLFQDSAPSMMQSYGKPAAIGLGVAAAAGAFDTPKVNIPEGTLFEPITQAEIDAVRVGVAKRAPDTPASSLVVPPSGIPGVNPGPTYENYLVAGINAPNVNAPDIQAPQINLPGSEDQIFGFDRFGNPIRSVYGAAKGGGIEDFPRKTGAINGPGTPTSDSIPAMLSDGEFVMNAKAVKGAGGGNREKGMQRMYDMMKRFEGNAVA